VGKPDDHPRWGYVPSASAVVIGILGLAGVMAVIWIWFPRGLFWGLVALVIVGLCVSAVVQAALGHRGMCWLQRTIRWWMGPVGAMVDPFDLG